LLAGAVAATYAAITLLHPGTILDRAWVLNSEGHAKLQPMARLAGPLFLVLAAALAAAGVGWFQQRRWGWRLAVLLIGANLVGDLVNLIAGSFLKGSVGVLIAGAILGYLLRPGTRAAFR